MISLQRAIASWLISFSSARLSFWNLWVRCERAFSPHLRTKNFLNLYPTGLTHMGLILELKNKQTTTNLESITTTFQVLCKELRGMESRWCFHLFPQLEGHTFGREKRYEKWTAGCISGIKEQDLVFWTRIMLTKSLSPAVQSISSQSIGRIFFRTLTDKSRRFLNLKRDSKYLKKGP